MKIDISIITVSQKNDNLKILTKTIKESNLDGLKIELICGWNGDRPANLKSEGLHFPIQIFDEKPYHFSKNNNKLAIHAKGTYLLFLNDDVELDPECIRTAWSAMKNPETGIVGANLRYPSGKIQHAGIFFDKNQKPYHRYKNLIFYKDPRLAYDLVVPAVTGAFLMMEAHEFKEIYFDESCLVAGQDVVLCNQYSKLFGKNILYVAGATAIHRENDTRKDYDQRITPEQDLEIIKHSLNAYITPGSQRKNEKIKLRIVTEKPGWIMHRMAAEIANKLPNVVINDDYPDANIHYYINYGYLRERPKNGIVVANFTHYDPDHLAEQWERAAQISDHCIAISNLTARDIHAFKIPANKVSVIPIGAGSEFSPKMTLGIVGRTYKGGRKGEFLVQELLKDQELMEGLQIVAQGEGWNIPIWSFPDRADFYRSIDYLLIPSVREGGPVPFMEALACGTMSIAPAIGVIPDFPHIPYDVGSISSLKETIQNLKADFLERKSRLATHIKPWNWDTWAFKHVALFHRLLSQESPKENEPSLPRLAVG